MILARIVMWDCINTNAIIYSTYLTDPLSVLLLIPDQFSGRACIEGFVLASWLV